MSGKNADILNFLKELTQRRLLGDELENALSPFKGTVLSLDLIFQSSSNKKLVGETSAFGVLPILCLPALTCCQNMRRINQH